jgi:ADP-sugar diphosphatase
MNTPLRTYLLPASRLNLVARHLRRMSTFTLPSTATRVHLTPDLTQDQLLSFRPFKSWLSKLQHSLSLQATNANHPFHDEEYALESIAIQSVDFFGSGDSQRIGFLKLKTTIKNQNGDSIPGSVFLRGGSVAILLILEPEGAGAGERWAVLTVQPRVPAGSLEMAELPAGMIDDAGTFSGAAAKEIQEECGIEIPEDKLIDLTSLALNHLAETDNERLEEAVYPSPGGSDEFIKIFAHIHRVKRDTLKEWQGKLTGLRDHGEKITLKLVKLGDLWKTTRDVKALSAVALWDGLSREGRV